jgi:hypothetical protein
MACERHASLDAVLAEIEKHTGAFAGAISAKVSLRRRLIAFQWRRWRSGRRSALPSHGSSPVVLHAALVAYFKLLRMAAQACDTPESAALLPGMVAQPPFSTYVACSHVLVFFSAVRLLAPSALC